MESEGGSTDGHLPETNDNPTPLVHVQKMRPKRAKNVRPSSAILPSGIQLKETLPDRSSNIFAADSIVSRSKSLEEIDSPADGKIIDESATHPTVSKRKSLVPIFAVPISQSDLNQSKLLKKHDEKKPEVKPRTIPLLNATPISSVNKAAEKLTELEPVGIRQDSKAPEETKLNGHQPIILPSETVRTTVEPTQIQSERRKISVGNVFPPPAANYKVPLRSVRSLSISNGVVDEAKMQSAANSQPSTRPTVLLLSDNLERKRSTSEDSKKDEIVPQIQLNQPSTEPKPPGTSVKQSVVSKLVSALNDANVTKTTTEARSPLIVSRRNPDFHKRYSEFYKAMRSVSMDIHADPTDPAVKVNVVNIDILRAQPVQVRMADNGVVTVNVRQQPTASVDIPKVAEIPLTPPPTPVDNEKLSIFTHPTHHHRHSNDLQVGLEKLISLSETSETVDIGQTTIADRSVIEGNSDKWQFPSEKRKSLRLGNITSGQIDKTSPTTPIAPVEVVFASSISVAPEAIKSPSLKEDHSNLNSPVEGEFFGSVKLKRIPPALASALKSPSIQPSMVEFGASREVPVGEEVQLASAKVATAVQTNITSTMRDTRTSSIRRQIVTRSLVIEPSAKANLQPTESVKRGLSGSSDNLLSSTNNSASLTSIGSQSQEHLKATADEDNHTNKEGKEFFGTIRLKPVSLRPTNSSSNSTPVETVMDDLEDNSSRKSFIGDKIRMFERPLKIPTKRLKPLIDSA